MTPLAIICITRVHAGVFPCQLKQDDTHIIIIQPDGRVVIQANETPKRKKLNTPTKHLPEKDPDISEEESPLVDAARDSVADVRKAAFLAMALELLLSCMITLLRKVRTRLF
jgi:hypothetical protein